MVLKDVAHDHLVQFLGAGEDASRDHIALDLVKPALLLVEPWRVDGRVVDMYIGCQQQSCLDQDRSVAAHDAADHTDLLVLVRIGHDVYQ